MIDFEVKGKQGHAVLHLFTSLSEITPEYLKELTDGVAVGDNYALVAVLHREKLSNIILAGRQKKNELSTAVLPVFVKSGKTDAEFISSIKTKERLVISGSDLSLGHHISVPGNIISPEKIISMAEGDGFCYQSACKVTQDVWFIQFKLIPNCNIHGFYKADADKSVVKKYEEKFIEMIKDEGEV